MPGWFVAVHTSSAPEVWVLNPKMLGAYIERDPVGLKAEDVAVVASRILKGMQKVLCPALTLIPQPRFPGEICTEPGEDGSELFH